MNKHYEDIQKAIVSAINDRALDLDDLIDLFTLLHVAVSNVITHLIMLKTKQSKGDDRNSISNTFSDN